MPIPFIEAGINYYRLALRGNLGYFIAYGEARPEIAYLCNIRNYPFSVFTNFGPFVNIAGAGYSWGIGVDMDSKKHKRRYYRIQVDIVGTCLGSTSASGYNGSMDLRDGTKIFMHVSALPRIGIGWRF
jgi:hypothetical protein